MALMLSGLLIGSAPGAQAAVVPIAYYDAYAGDQSQTISVAAPGILANDFGVNAAYVAKLISSNIWDGSTLTVNTDGSFAFHPAAGLSGQNMFHYCLALRVGNGDCVSNIEEVDLFVGEPFIAIHAYATSAGATLSVPAESGILAGSANPQPGDELFVIIGAHGGTLVASPDGSFTYTPAPGFTGTDAFGACFATPAQSAQGICAGNVGSSTIAVFPNASGQSIQVTQDSAYQGSLYPAPSGAITYSGLVTAPAAHGTVDIGNDGTFGYVPAAGYAGPDAFTFCITQDNQTCAPGGGTATVSITVVPLTIPTTTTVSGPSLQHYGDAATFTAHVSPDPAGGTVSFADNGSALAGCGAVPVVAGVAACAVPAPGPAAGEHSITAGFSGSGVYLPSSGQLPLTVAQQTSSTIVTASSPSIQWGDPVTLTAFVNPAGAGSVSFSMGSAPLCPAVPLVGGIATCSPADLPIGTDGITATYSGDAAIAGSAGQTVVVVTKRDAAIAYTGATTGVVGQPLAVSARLDDGATGDPLAGRAVVFSLGTATCTANADAISGTASCTLTPTSAGAGDVTAAFAGDDHVNPAQVQTPVAIDPSPTTLTLTAPATAQFTAPVSLLASVSPTDGSGTVAFALGGQPIAGCTAVPLAAAGSSWQASCTTSALPVGSQSVSALYSGSPDYVGSGDVAAVEVTPAQTALDYTGPTTGTVSQPIVVTAVLTDVATGAPAPIAGAGLTFALAGLSCVATTGPDGSGACTLTPTGVAQTGTIIVSYAGSAEYRSTQDAAAMTISPSPTATSLAAPAAAAFTESVTLVATIAPSDGAGSVDFILGGEPVPGCAAVPLASDDGAWTARCVTTALPVGGDSVTAAFSGTDDYLASEDAASIEVAPATTIASYTGPSRLIVGEEADLSARLLDAVDGAGLAGLDLRITWGAASCDATTDADGVAHCRLAPTAVAQAGAVSAVFAGTPEFLGSSATADLRVDPAATRTSVAAAGSGPFPVPIAVVATVAPTDGAGTVSFAQDGEPVPNCQGLPLAQNAEGWQAVCQAVPAGAGTRAFTAAFSGTADYLPSSGAGSVDVPAAPQQAGPALAQTGASPAGPAAAGWALLLIGALAVAASRARRRG